MPIWAAERRRKLLGLGLHAARRQLVFCTLAAMEKDSCEAAIGSYEPKIEEYESMESKHEFENILSST